MTNDRKPEFQTLNNNEILKAFTKILKHTHFNSITTSRATETYGFRFIEIHERNALGEDLVTVNLDTEINNFALSFYGYADPVMEIKCWTYELDEGHPVNEIRELFIEKAKKVMKETRFY